MDITVLVVLAGFLAVSTNAAGISYVNRQQNYGNQYETGYEPGYEVGTNDELEAEAIYEEERQQEKIEPTQPYEEAREKKQIESIQPNDEARPKEQIEPSQFNEKVRQQSIAKSESQVTVETKTENIVQATTEGTEKPTQSQGTTSQAPAVSTTTEFDSWDSDIAFDVFEPKASSKPKSASNLISIPIMKFVMKSLGKDALRNFDIGTVCDTVQMVDWKSYQDLLLQDDYAGIKEKLSKDDVINTVTETFQEYIAKYSKILSNVYNNGISEKSLSDILGLLSFHKKIPLTNPLDMQNNIREFIQGFGLDKKVQTEGLETMQNNMKMLLQALQGATGQKSVEVSNRNAQHASKGQNY